MILRMSPEMRGALCDPPEVSAWKRRVDTAVTMALADRTEREFLGLPPDEKAERLLAAYSRLYPEGET